MLIDFAFVLVICLAVYLGLKKGLIRAIVSFFTYFIAMMLAVKFSSVVAPYIKSAGGFQKWIPLLSFLAIFISVILLGGLLARMLEKSSEIVMLGWLNRLGGIAFYVLNFTILFSAVMFFGMSMKWFQPRQLDESFFVRSLAGLAPLIMENIGKIIPPFKDSFNDLEHFFGTYKG